MSCPFWGRIVHREGIVKDIQFKTKAEADAYALGVNNMIEEADISTDSWLGLEYAGVTSDIEAQDE